MTEGVVSIGGHQEIRLAAVRWKLAGLGLLMALAVAALECIRSNGTVFQMLAWFEVLLLAGVYWRGYAIVQSSGTPALPTVVIFGGIFALLGLFLPPLDLADLYAYTNRGWMQYHYGLNPYTRFISAAPGWQHDPMFTRAWASVGFPYGFLFAMLAKLIAAIGGGHLARTVLLFKLTSAAAYGASAILIRAIGARIGLARVDLALYLYLWSPVIVIHSLANGHNDSLAALFVLLAIWFAASELPLLILPMLTASLMIKTFAEMILPFAFLYVARRSGLFRAFGSALASAAFFVVCALPYRTDWTPLPRETFLEAWLSPNYSLTSAAYWTVAAANKLFPLGTMHRWAIDVSMAVFPLAGCVLLAAAIIRFAANPRPSVQDLAAAAVLAQAILILVALSYFGAWYLSALIPTALLLAPGHWLRRLVMTLSITWLFYFTVLGDLRILNALIMMGVPMVWIGFEQWEDVKSSFVNTAK